MESEGGNKNLKQTVMINSIVTRNKGNKGNYAKNDKGDIFFCGYLIKGNHMYKLSINELIQFKSILINF